MSYNRDDDNDRDESESLALLLSSIWNQRWIQNQLKSQNKQTIYQIMTFPNIDLVPPLVLLLLKRIESASAIMVSDVR